MSIASGKALLSEVTAITVILEEVIKNCTFDGLSIKVLGMAFKFEFDATHRIFRARFYGPVNDASLSQFYATAPAYVLQLSPRVGLTDFSEVTLFLVSAAEIRSIAAQPPITQAPNFIRIIVAPAPHIFGLSRMFQIFGEATRPGMAVVHSLKEALQLLEITHANFEPIDPGQTSQQAANQ